MLMKMGLFITAGTLAEDKKTREICGLKGLWKSHPLWVSSFTVLSAAIVGIPPMNGFMSKWFIILSSAGAGTVIPALVIAAGTVISAAYYLRVLSAFISPEDERSESASAAPPRRIRRKGISLALVTSFALLCLVLGATAFSPISREFFSSIGDTAVDVGAYVELVTGR
jgi:multicomponent Na+:H+ antiporter subunit D